MENETETKYNWDDLEVGRFELNHSERFFARKHVKHEKVGEIALNHVSTMNRENVPDSTSSSAEKLAEKVKKSTPQNFKAISSANKPKSTAFSNIARQPLTNKNQLALVPKTNVVPSVVRYKEIYDRKRQEMIRRQLEEDRKKRMFRSKPAPNFAVDPKPKKTVESARPLTIPATPLVLKHSKEMEERRKRQMEEYMKQNEPPKFQSRNPQALYEEPFKPHKSDHHVEPLPFNLQTEKRLKERRNYDKLVKQKIEEKKKQEEHEQKKQEERLVQEIRKMTTFKARPNPFK